MKKLLLFAVMAAMFVFAGCSQKPKDEAKAEGETPAATEQPAAAEGGVIKIGVAGAHSGDLASYGIPSLKAAELVVKQVNEKGGLLGKKVELVPADDVCKPEVAVSSANKLVSEGVVAVLGHICSGATKAAMGTYLAAKIPVMSPSATSPDLTKSGEYPNFFRTIAPDDAQARLEIDFATDVLKVSKVAIIHDKGDYGKGLAEYAKQFAEADGKLQVVLFEGITPGAVDYSAIVQKIKQSGAEAVIYGGYHPEASKIITLIVKKKVPVKFISDDGVKDDTFIKVAGTFAEGVYATGPKDTSTNPLTIEATKLHKETYGEDPGAFYLNAYTAMLAITNAIEKAGSTDYDAVTNALRTEYVETPIGKIKFDEKGDAIGAGFSVYQVQNGVYVEIQ
ncbi:MAG: branched-chain amino acid ABC transporter substrate-binding protein [Deferribacterales bacterium]